MSDLDRKAIRPIAVASGALGLAVMSAAYFFDIPGEGPETTLFLTGAMAAAFGIFGR